MHRCEEHGLSIDAEGFTRDPDAQDADLYALVRYVENPYERIAFTASLAFAFDPVKAEENRIWRHIYLKRYGRFSLDEIENMPVSLLARYVATLSELIKKEAGPSSSAETNYT